jgi:hypothetical protein
MGNDLQELKKMTTLYVKRISGVRGLDEKILTEVSVGTILI